MRRSREMRTGVVLVVVALVLSAVALATDVPDLLIVVLFVISAVAVHFAWPDGRADD